MEADTKKAESDDGNDEQGGGEEDDDEFGEEEMDYDENEYGESEGEVELGMAWDPRYNGQGGPKKRRLKVSRDKLAACYSSSLRYRGQQNEPQQKWTPEESRRVRTPFLSDTDSPRAPASHTFGYTAACVALLAACWITW